MDTIVIEKTGVVYFSEGYETALRVDRFNLLAELAEQLEASIHSTDFDGRFAGRVKIEVEFLGEPMSEERHA